MIHFETKPMSDVEFAKMATWATQEEATKLRRHIEGQIVGLYLEACKALSGAPESILNSTGIPPEARENFAKAFRLQRFLDTFEEMSKRDSFETTTVTII